MTDTLFAVDVEARTISGLLLPFGEMSRPSLSGAEPVMFSAETDLTLPVDPTIAPLFGDDHNRYEPRGRGVSFEKTDAGIVATFTVGRTPEGDALLAAAQEEPRPRLSAEIKGLVRRGATAIKGVLTGASIVREGAFASAALFAVADAITDEPDTDEDDPAVERGIDQATDPAPAETDTTEGAQPEATHQEDTPMTEVTNPATVPAGLTAPRQDTPAALSIRDVDSMVYGVRNGMFALDAMKAKLDGQNTTSDALFALTVPKFDGAGGLTPTITAAPQWMAEVWTAAIAGFKQSILPLFNHQDLTGFQLAGWRWGTQPAGGDYAGNAGAVPSNALAVSPVTQTALRYAIGHEFPREFIDFPQAGFFESYAAAVTRDYQKWSDGKVAAAAVAGATVLAGDAWATIPGNPAITGGNVGGTIGPVMSAIIDGAAAISVNGILPEFALLNPTDWKKLIKLPKNNVLGYLNAALGVPEGSLDGFKLRPSAAVAAGKVLVGVGAAATVYELPGVPVRIDALNVAQGAVDQAAFGYVATVINDATGLQLVTIATA